MATGKTTIGKELVKSLSPSYKFVETDNLIEKMAKKTIPEIFSQKGEAYFRKLEAKACKKVASMKKVVISCGGGVILNKKNIVNLKKNCYLILLKADIDTIYNRIIKDGKDRRPLINKKNPKNEIKKLMKIRKSLYEKYADFSIETNNKKPKEIVKEILHKIGIENLK